MDSTLLLLIQDPVLIIFILCTLAALIGKFLRSWIISCMMVLFIGLLLIVIAVTIGQLAGLEQQIRYLITAEYSFFSNITLTLRDIILTTVIVMAFQLALAFHITKADVDFQRRFFRIPRKQCCHYEMDYTIDTLSKKYQDEEN